MAAAWQGMADELATFAMRYVHDLPVPWDWVVSWLNDRPRFLSFRGHLILKPGSFFQHLNWMMLARRSSLAESLIAIWRHGLGYVRIHNYPRAITE